MRLRRALLAAVAVLAVPAAATAGEGLPPSLRAKLAGRSLPVSERRPEEAARLAGVATGHPALAVDVAALRERTLALYAGAAPARLPEPHGPRELAGVVARTSAALPGDVSTGAEWLGYATIGGIALAASIRALRAPRRRDR